MGDPDTHTQILVTQGIVLTELGHIKTLLEKQNGRVSKLEDRYDSIEDRVAEGEKTDVKNKAYLGGIAATIGAVAAVGVDKVSKIIGGWVG